MVMILGSLAPNLLPWGTSSSVKTGSLTPDLSLACFLPCRIEAANGRVERGKWTLTANSDKAQSLWLADVPPCGLHASVYFNV